MSWDEFRGFFGALLFGLGVGIMMIFWAVSTAGVTFTVAMGGGIKGTVVVGNYICTGQGKGQTCSQYGDFSAPPNLHVRDATLYGFPNDVTKGQRFPAVYVPRYDTSSVYAANDKGDFIWTIIRFLLGVALIAGVISYLVYLIRQRGRVKRGEPVAEFGEVPARGELPPNVLLHARVNDYDWQTHRGREMWRLRLTDDGDHLTWFDGKRSHRWRLPNQPGDMPALSRAVLLTWGQYETSLKQPSTTLQRLVLVDDQQKVLASVLTTHYLTEEDMGRFWPSDQFTALAERGVPYTTESFDDVSQIPKHYRGAVSDVRVALFSRKGAMRNAIIVGVLAALVAGVVLWAYLRRS